MTVLALASSGDSAPRAIPLLSVLGRGTTVVSWSRWRAAHLPSELPDAIVATDVEALDGLPAVAVAAWVTGSADRAVAEARGATVLLTDRPDLAGPGVLLVHPAAIDVARVAPMAPLVRARHRDRAGLPEVLVTRPPAGGRLAEPELRRSSAVVADEPDLALALALGTPTVTSAAAARRIGAEPGRDLLVASDPDPDPVPVALRLALDPERSARLSAQGRRFAEQHLDLGAVAAAVRSALGLAPAAPASGSGALDHRLDELATPPGGWVRVRMATLVGIGGHDLGQTPPMADPPPTSAPPSAAARGRALLARAVSPLRSRVGAALAAAAARDHADLRAELEHLQRDLEQARVEHAVELAVLHEELAALRGRGPTTPSP